MKYRIIRDNYAGYEVQLQRFLLLGRWFPYWKQARGPLGGPANTFSTIRAATAYAKKCATGPRVEVVKEGEL